MFATYSMKPSETIYSQITQAIQEYRREHNAFNFSSFAAHHFSGTDGRTGMERAAALSTEIFKTQNAFKENKDLLEDAKIRALFLTIREFNHGSELMDKLAKIFIDHYKLERKVQTAAERISTQFILDYYAENGERLDNTDPRVIVYASTHSHDPDTQVQARRRVFTAELETLERTPLSPTASKVTEIEAPNAFT